MSKAEQIKAFVDNLASSWLPKKRADIEKNHFECHHYSPLRSISIKETDHSRILGELLDPQGSHGQGNLFLHEFLKLLKVNAPAEGVWQVSIEKGRIDILLRRENPASVIIIENKANSAVDQQHQLYRYWLQEIHGYYPNLDYDCPDTRSKFKMVYAPPLAFQKPTPTSLSRPPGLLGAPANHPIVPLPLTYCSFTMDFAPWLEELAKNIEVDRLKIFLKLYAEIWRL